MGGILSRRSGVDNQNPNAPGANSQGRQQHNGHPQPQLQQQQQQQQQQQRNSDVNPSDSAQSQVLILRNPQSKSSSRHDGDAAASSSSAAAGPSSSNTTHKDPNGREKQHASNEQKQSRSRSTKNPNLTIQTDKENVSGDSATQSSSKGKGNRQGKGKSGPQKGKEGNAIFFPERFRETIASAETLDIKRIISGYTDNEAPVIHDIFLAQEHGGQDRNQTDSQSEHSDSSYEQRFSVKAQKFTSQRTIKFSEADEDFRSDMDDGQYDDEQGHYVDSLYAPTSHIDDTSSHYIQSERMENQSERGDDLGENAEDVREPMLPIPTSSNVTKLHVETLEDVYKPNIMNDFGGLSNGAPIRVIESFIQTLVVPALIDTRAGGVIPNFPLRDPLDDSLGHVSPAARSFVEFSRNAIRVCLGLETDPPKQTHSVLFCGPTLNSTISMFKNVLVMSQPSDRSRKLERTVAKQKSILLLDRAESLHMQKLVESAGFDVDFVDLSSSIEGIVMSLPQILAKYADRPSKMLLTTPYSFLTGAKRSLDVLQGICHSHSTLFGVHFYPCFNPIQQALFQVEGKTGRCIDADFYILSPSLFLGGLGSSYVLVTRNILCGFHNRIDNLSYFQSLKINLEAQNGRADFQFSPLRNTTRKIQQQLESDTINVSAAIRSGLVMVHQALSDEVDVESIFLHPDLSAQCTMLKQIIERQTLVPYIQRLCKKFVEIAGSAPGIQILKMGHEGGDLMHVSFVIWEQSKTTSTRKETSSGSFLSPALVQAALKSEYSYSSRCWKSREAISVEGVSTKSWCQIVPRTFHSLEDIEKLADAVIQISNNAKSLLELYTHDPLYGWRKTR